MSTHAPLRQITGQSRWRCSLCALVVLLGAALPIAADEVGPQIPFLQQYCIACHDSDALEGGFDLTQLPNASTQAADFDASIFNAWVKVLDKVQAADMPPASESQPSDEAREAFCDSLAGHLHAVSLERQERLGRVVYRRLNRTEYANTLHDFLGVNTPLRELLPEEATVGGFDNVGEALNLSVAHLERYLVAADMALRDATVQTIREPAQRIRTDYEETWHDYNHGFQNSQWVNAEDGNLALIGGGGAIPHGTLRAWSPPVADATYRFRVRARAMMQRKEGGKEQLVHDRAIVARLGLGSQLKDGSAKPIAFVELSPDEYREFEFEARVPAGQTFAIAPHRIVKQSTDDKAMEWGMCVVVDWVEIEGPLFESTQFVDGPQLEHSSRIEHSSRWPPRGHRFLYGDLPLASDLSTENEVDGAVAVAKEALRVASASPVADAERLLNRFLPVAFRRPVTPQELAWHMELFNEQLGLGRPFDESLRAAYKMALTSPQFLFLEESPGSLNDHALACRLSYGLCGTLPDQELRELANAGSLSSPDVLRQQTDRLLHSPQSRRFVEQFLDSWLNLRDIDFTRPDLQLYPEFDSYLQSSMLAESRAFFAEILRENLSISNIVDSQFTYLNARLAEHYGLEDAYREHLQRAADSVPAQTVSLRRSLDSRQPAFPHERDRLQKVNLPDDSPRGGFITQGAVLKVSANGTTTSPIIRGAYFLERIMGTPPAPPPANVPAVEPDIRGATTIREQLAKHRDQVACAGCHAIIDPPGFALESFDATGRWRTHYRIIPESAADKLVKNAGSDVRYYEDGPVVDTNYQLPDGRKFRDIEDFKSLIVADSTQLARAMVEKLTTHLTGAAPQFADRVVIDAILAETRGDGYRLRDLIHGVIQSRMFRNK